MQKPYRRSIRLEGADYTGSGAYYVTICTENKVCLFGTITAGVMTTNAWGRVAEECWLSIPSHFPFGELGPFVVMPNHIHGVIVINDTSVGAQHAAPANSNPHVVAGSLGAIVRSFKSATTREINLLRKTPGVGLWQRNYYEHIIRDLDDEARIHDYIITNPERWPQDTLFRE